MTHETRARHTGVDFLGFLERIARAYPTGDVHVIPDNVSIHEAPDVKAWPARHERLHFRFTPTSTSWMNQIEMWFGILTRQALRHVRWPKSSVGVCNSPTNCSTARASALTRCIRSARI